MGGNLTLKVYIRHCFVFLLIFNYMKESSLKIFPDSTVRRVRPREHRGSAETQIWALFQIHVLSGQRWDVSDAFGLSI